MERDHHQYREMAMTALKMETSILCLKASYKNLRSMSEWSY